MRALVSERRGCKANRYVLVSTGDLQPRDAEWKDIALRRQDGRVEDSYQAALQVAALHIGALHIAVLQIAALQINDCDQFFSLDSLKPVRTCSAASNANLPFACKPCCWIANLLTSLFAAVTESHLWPLSAVCSSHSEQEIP